MLSRCLPLVVLLGCTPSSGGLIYEPTQAIDDDDATDDDDDVESSADVLVNELMADNRASIFDGTGATSDWIELFNTTTERVDLQGWSLSDDWTVPDLHVFPQGVSVEPRGHLMLWASGSDDLVNHVPFGLARDGEAVGLFDPEGRSVDWVQFPAMAADIAYARIRDGWEDWGELEDGTPGSEN